MTEFRPIDIDTFTPATLTDQPQPMLEWVDIDHLVIDTRYQRSLTSAGKRAIQRIANEFDWRKYQPVLIAPTDGGMLAVVDGQHRAHAAKLAGLKRIPAMIVAMTPVEQAAGFAAVNRDQIRLSQHQIYRAELAAGIEWAVMARDAVEAGGCRIATAHPSSYDRKPRVIYAPALIKKMILADEARAVTVGLTAITRSSQVDDIAAYGNPILSVWLPALASCNPFLSLHDLPTIFDSCDIQTMLDDAKASVVSRQSPRAVAIEKTTNILRGALNSARAA